MDNTSVSMNEPLTKQEKAELRNRPMERLIDNFSKGNFDVTAEEIFGTRPEDEHDPEHGPHEWEDVGVPDLGQSIAPWDKPHTTLDDLNAAVKRVASLRAGYALTSGMLAARRKQFEEENALLIATVNAESATLESAERQAKDLAVSLYDGANKKVAPGVGIRETTVLNYDGKKAFDWSLDHKLFVALDVKPFETYAKKTPPDFVTVTTKITATLATDLDKALSET